MCFKMNSIIFLNVLVHLTISIEEVEWMDRHGVKAMTGLHDEAVLKNKKLSIIGLGCKELYEHFKYKTTA